MEKDYERTLVDQLDIGSEAEKDPDISIHLNINGRMREYRKVSGAIMADHKEDLRSAQMRTENRAKKEDPDDDVQLFEKMPHPRRYPRTFTHRPAVQKGVELPKEKKQRATPLQKKPELARERLMGS